MKIEDLKLFRARVTIREEQQIVDRFNELICNLTDSQIEGLSREDLKSLLAQARGQSPDAVILQHSVHHAEELRFNS